MSRIALALTTTLLAIPLAAAAMSGEGSMTGKMAPEISAGQWFNHVGRELNLKNLRGQTVLIDFWATWCPPCRMTWPHLQELHEEFAKDGLVVLALSDEVPEKVSAFLDENGYTARTASGCADGKNYGVTGIPHSFLIDPTGKIVWDGHPQGLTAGTVKDALKGAKPMPSASYLAYRSDKEQPKNIAAVVKSAEDGKLGKAVTAAAALAADPKTAQADKDAALAFKAELDAYVASLHAQAEKLLERHDVVASVGVLETLGKELDGQDAGAKAAARAKAIRADPATAKELEAAEAWEKTKKECAKLGTGKAKDKYKEFAKKFNGTRAAEMAEARARG